MGEIYFNLEYPYSKKSLVIKVYSLEKGKRCKLFPGLLNNEHTAQKNNPKFQVEISHP